MGHLQPTSRRDVLQEHFSTLAAVLFNRPAFSIWGRLHSSAQGGGAPEQQKTKNHTNLLPQKHYLVPSPNVLEDLSKTLPVFSCFFA